MAIGAGQLPAFDFRDENLPPVRSIHYGAAPHPVLVVGLIVLYCLMHFAVRLNISPAFVTDEAELMLMSQALALGYQLEQPPLASWVFGLADIVVGLSKPVFFTLKYTIMAAGLIFFYMAARIVFRWYSPETGRIESRNDLSAAAVAAWALFSQTAWAHHASHSNYVLLFAVLSLNMHAFFAALASQTRRDWAYFGFAAGLALLTEHHAVMMPAGMFLSAMTVAALARGRADRNGYYQPSRLSILNVLLAGVIAAAMISPYAYWAWISASSFNDAVGVLQAKSTIPLDAIDYSVIEEQASTLPGWLEARMGSLHSLLESTWWFLFPFPFIFMLLFWPMWMPVVVPFFPKRKVEEDENDIIWRRLILRTMLFSGLLYIFAACATGVEFETRWLLMVFLPLPLWAFLQVQRSGPYFISMRGYIFVIAIAVVSVAAWRVFDWNKTIDTCRPSDCAAHLPAQEWAEALEARGFTTGTIVGAEFEVLGNLRYHLPQARVIDAAYDYVSYPPPSSDYGLCMVVWREDPEMPEAIYIYLTEEMGMTVRDRTPEDAIQRYLTNSYSLPSVLYYKYLPPSDTCE